MNKIKQPKWTKLNNRNEQNYTTEMNKLNNWNEQIKQPKRTN